ncbi:hypothetical protein [Burkholderia vietnamiensis]|uniref:hypothetical protein n=1 Tax=Burkholderia vietnamiensis TaxID=60552 RepID=UPI000B140CB8|nr:hypothetical protein [Burkholderia vietnamiensis]HDR9174363.1 hypothetical protein [Burkholderia vietnamiensis]
MFRGIVVAAAGVVALSGCASGSLGESAASGVVQGAMSAVGLDVVTASLGGDVVQGVNRAAYGARKDAEAANTPRPDNGVVPKMSATQAALNGMSQVNGQKQLQVDSPDWKAPPKIGVAPPASVPGAASGARAETAAATNTTASQ